MESAAPAVKKQKTASEEAVESEKTKSKKRYKSAPSVNKQLEEDPKLRDIDDGKETKVEGETEKLTKPAEDEKDGLAETLICIICQEILHDCIRCVVLYQNQTKC